MPVPPPPIPPLPPEEPPLPEEEEEQVSSGDESEYESDNAEEKERCAFYSLNTYFLLLWIVVQPLVKSLNTCSL